MTYAHGIDEYHAEERQRVAQILKESRDLEPAQRVEKLNHLLAESLATRKLMLSESFSVMFGRGTAAYDFVGEDPRFDDGEVWDEVGFHRGGGRSRFSRQRLITRRTLDHAREIGRYLATENEYVIGSMENRVAYTVGEGLVWKALPRQHGAQRADRGLLRQVMDRIKAFRDQECMDELEQEWIRRQDRDGEAILRVFANPEGPPLVRFIEPEDLDQPAEFHADLPARALHALSLGVETDPNDVRSLRGLWVRPDALVQPAFVVADTGMGIRHIHHAKLNVDLKDPRGWPTYWPIRRNMQRAEKLLRNMSYVAALQAAIALIRKHERGTKSEIEEMLAQHRDLVVQNKATGKDRSFRKFGPGTIIDQGPGMSYEAPISSVNAGANVEVLGADLRAGAVAVNQPAYMFSGKPGEGGYAGALVAEGPAHKNFKRLQNRARRRLTHLHWDVIRHEVFWGRLPEEALHVVRLEAEFPEVQTRDLLQSTQRNQIMRQAGVISLHTWRSKEGLSPDEEERLIAAESGEVKRWNAIHNPEDAAPGAKPAPGSTAGGPGGQEQVGNLSDPGSAPSSNFESLRGDAATSEAAAARLAASVGLELSANDRRLVRVAAVLQDPSIPAAERVRLALALLKEAGAKPPQPAGRDAEEDPSQED